MVDDPAVARAELDGRDRPVRIDRDRDHEAAIDVRARSAGTSNGSGTLSTRSGVPSCHPSGNFGGGRQVLRVSLRRPGLGPVGDLADLALRPADARRGTSRNPARASTGGIRRLSVISARKLARLAASL